MKTFLPFILVLALFAPHARAQINVTKTSVTNEVTQNFTIASGKVLTNNGTISGPGNITITGNGVFSGNATSFQIGGNGTALTLNIEGTTTLSVGLATVTANGTLPTSRVFISPTLTNNSSAFASRFRITTTTNSFSINATSTANATVSDNSTISWKVSN